MPNLLGRLSGSRAVAAVVRPIARRLANGDARPIPWGAGRGLVWLRLPGYGITTFLGLHEPAVQRALVRAVGEGDVVYDVGAHVGFFSLLAARRVGDRGAVFAFEPLARNAEVVRRHVALNGAKNCQVIEAAVCDREGMANFSSGSRPNRARLAEADARVKPDCHVPTLSLDAFAATHPRPTFIKLDAERAEALALRGMRGLLAGPRAPRLLVELHTDALAEECAAILEAAGYRLQLLTGKPAKPPWVKGHYLALPPG